VQGCLQAAYTAERTGDSAKAAAMYERACDGGAAEACNRLGAMAWAGRGMPASPERAYALYVRACEGGDGAGCFSAAICHRTGTCAPKDEPRQKQLLARGCELKDARACAEVKAQETKR
jgi:TPR repeat protein